ncbi:YdgA family protein [Aeromonas sanarellii]|nr:YdgA family protein [Aeromonas sanarellii]
MKKKVALAVGAVLVVGGLGACWYTGNTFDRILAEQIARAQQESGIEITWHPTTEHLFARDGMLKVVVPPETLASLDPQLAGSEPIEMQFAFNSRMLPLYIKSHLLLDTAQGTLAPIFSSLGMQQWQLGAESASSLWTMSNSSRFWVGDFKVREGMNEFNFLPLSGDYRGDLDGNGHMTVQWLGMTVHDAQSKMDLALADLKGSADMAEISGLWLSPRSDATLSAFTLTQPGNIRISLQGLSTATQLAGDDAQTLSSRYQMQVETLNLESEEDSLTLTEGNLDLALNGLDLEGYQTLQEVSGQRVDESAIQEALDKMLQRGVTLQLTDFSARLNGEPVSLQGEARLASTTLAQLMGSEEGMQALSGLLHAHLGDKLGQAVPQLAPMLAQFTALGYLKAEQAQLQAELKLDKGQLTVNGLPLQP